MPSRANVLVVSSEPNRFHIVARVQNSGLFHKAWDGSNWQPAQTDWNRLDLGGVLSAPAVVASPSGRLDIFVVGPDRAMVHKFLVPDSGGTWSEWEDLGGIFTSPPAVASWGPDRLENFGLGTKPAMFQKAWDGNSWQPTPKDWENLG